MSAAVLDGRALAAKILAALQPRVKAVKAKRGRAPRLLIVAGPDPASKSYRAEQLKACKAAGIDAEAIERPPSPSDLARCDAVLVERPLSPGLDPDAVLRGVPPERDAEGATSPSLGRLFALKSFDELGRDGLVAPCTALAIAALVRETRAPLAGKHAVVIGRSTIVGKPAAHLLTALDLTVTLCHSKTRDLARLAASADVVVAALGKPHFVKPDWIKPGAIVIDAGVNVDGRKLRGDVDPAAAERAGHLTPVPGGVGPVTTAMLLSNVVSLAERA